MKDRAVAMLAVVAALWPGSLPATDGAEPVPTVEAVWVEVERSFVYFGRTTFYSCQGLRDKVRYVLAQAGARPGFKVVAHCMETGIRFDRLPTLRIKAAFAAEATPERLAQFEEDASRRELLARVRGRSDDDGEPFAATRRTVEFTGRGRGRIEDGDCELLEHLVENVLRPAGVRVVEGSRLGCVPGQVPAGAVRLVLEVLQKVPPPDVDPAEAAPDGVPDVTQ